MALIHKPYAKLDTAVLLPVALLHVAGFFSQRRELRSAIADMLVQGAGMLRDGDLGLAALCALGRLWHAATMSAFHGVMTVGPANNYICSKYFMADSDDEQKELVEVCTVLCPERGLEKIAPTRHSMTCLIYVKKKNIKRGEGLGSVVYSA